VPFSTEHGHAFQLNRNGGGKPIDFNGCSARLCLRVREVLGINAIESAKVPVHVHQKNGDVYQIFPLATIGFEDGLDIAENTVHLSGKIKGFEIAVVIQLEPRNSTIVGVAACDSRTNATQKQQISNRFRVGVVANWFRSLLHSYNLIDGKDAPIFFIVRISAAQRFGL